MSHSHTAGGRTYPLTVDSESNLLIRGLKSTVKNHHDTDTSPGFRNLECRDTYFTVSFNMLCCMKSAVIKAKAHGSPRITGRPTVLAILSSLRKD